MIEIVLIAAVADNGVIGRDNALPWRLKSDMQRFRALTRGKPVVMGRKTFLSIGAPLKGRTNIVISRGDFSAAGIVIGSDLDLALRVARADALRRGVGEIMVLGGAQVYAALIRRAHRLEITRVHASPPGDAMFPPIDESVWREVDRATHPAGPEDTAAFSFLRYRRVNESHLTTS